MKTYDIVKMILLRDHRARNSDKHLMFEVWKYQDLNILDYETWMRKAAHPKSIIESRRNLQRDQEEALLRGEGINGDQLLIADDTVRKFREQINQEKGTHIYREEVIAPVMTRHKKPKFKCPNCGEFLKSMVESEPSPKVNTLTITKYLVCPNGDYKFEVTE